MERTREKTGFRDSLFDFYSFCLDHQAAGKTKSLIVWFILFLELLVYTLTEAYKSTLIESSSLDMIARFLVYVQIEQLSTISAYLYASISYSMKIVVLANFLIFFVFVVDKLKVFRIKKLAEIYCSYNFYNIFVFLLLFSETIMKDLMAAILKDFSPLMIAINILALILLFVDTMRHSFFMKFEYYSKDNCLVTTDDHFYTKMIAVKFFIHFLIFIGFAIPSTTIKIVTMTLLWMISAAIFLLLSLTIMFEKTSLNRAMSAFAGIYLALTSSLAISCFYSDFHFIFGFLAFAIATLLISNYKKLEVVGLHSNEELKKPKKVLSFTYEFLALAKKYEPNSSTAVLLKGQFNLHSATCTSSRCFCNTDRFYINTKNTFVKANKNENVSLFAKHMVRERLENLCEVYPDSYFHKYVLALFCHKKIKNKILAINIVKSIDKYELTLSGQFKIFRLMKLINKDQEEFNKDRLKEKKFDELLRYEEASNHFFRLIVDLFSCLNNFWSYMLNNFDISPNVFTSHTSKILYTKNELRSLLKIMEGFSSYSERLKFLHGFVRRELLNEKVYEKLDELYLNLDDEEHMSFHDDMTLLNANFYNTFLRNISCVIEISMNPATIGMIQKISESVTQIFGIDRNELLGKSINRLMPSAIGDRHSQILLDVAQKGILLSKNNSIISWGIYNDIFPVGLKIRYKMDLSLDANIYITGIVARIESHSEPNYYIITDDLGFITNMSLVFMNSLGITENDIQMKQINIGMLSKELLQTLPVNALLCRDDSKSNVCHVRRKNQATFEQKVNLSLAKNRDDVDREIQVFESLKTLEVEIVDGNRISKNPLPLDPLAKNTKQNMFKTDTKKMYSDEQKLSFNEENDSQSYKRLVTLDSKDPIHAYFLRDEKVSDNKERNPEAFLVLDTVNYNSLTVNLDIIPRRHESIKNFNVFVIKKIDPRTDFMITRDRGESKKTARHTGEYLDVGITKDLVSLSASNHQDEKDQSDKQDYSENMSGKSDSKFLPYIKQTLNLFHKEITQIPHKRYPKMTRLSYFFLAFFLMFAVGEILFLLLSKIPLLDLNQQISFEYHDIHRFEHDIMSSYTYLISSRYPDNLYNVTEIMIDRIKMAKESAQLDSVLKYIFDPEINPRFTHIFMPGLELTMNNAFLVHNFLYEMNKYVTGVENINNFTEERHTLFLEKFRMKLQGLFLTLQDMFQLELDNANSSIVSHHTIAYLIWHFIFGIVLLYVTLNTNVIMYKIFAINDTILHTDDMTITSIINYYIVAQKFFYYHFNYSEAQVSHRALEKSSIRSNLLIRERKKQWSSRNSKFKREVILYNAFYFLLMILWTGFVVGRFYAESSFYDNVKKAQDVGIAMCKDNTALSRLILIAKEYHIRNDSLNKTSTELIKDIDENLNPQIIPNIDGNSVENVVRSYYQKNVCEFTGNLNVTGLRDCRVIYSSLLMNTLNTVKVLLKAKVGFVFTNSSATAYNFTAAQIPSLDQVNIYMESAYSNMSEDWMQAFSNMISRYTILLIVLTSLFVLLCFFFYSLWNGLVMNRIDGLYRHERAIFMNFMPAETLKKTKLAQVQLARDEVLRQR